MLFCNLKPYHFTKEIFRVCTFSLSNVYPYLITIARELIEEVFSSLTISVAINVGDQKQRALYFKVIQNVSLSEIKYALPSFEKSAQKPAGNSRLA